MRGGDTLALLGKLIRVWRHGWAQSGTDSACSADTPGTLHGSRSFASGLIHIKASEDASRSVSSAQGRPSSSLALIREAGQQDATTITINC